MEAFLWIEQRYYHDIKIDLSDLETKKFREKNKNIEKDQIENPPAIDGRMTLGPNLLENRVYQKIKAQT